MLLNKKSDPARLWPQGPVTFPAQRASLLNALPSRQRRARGSGEGGGAQDWLCDGKAGQRGQGSSLVRPAAWSAGSSNALTLPKPRSAQEKGPRMAGGPREGEASMAPSRGGTRWGPLGQDSTGGAQGAGAPQNPRSLPSRAPGTLCSQHWGLDSSQVGES